MNKIANEQVDFQNKIKKAASEANKFLNQQKYVCLYPGCNNFAISSHSQQRKRQLQSISENNHVYAVEKNLCQKLRRMIDNKEKSYL